MCEKLKSHIDGDTLLLCGLVILVGIGSFLAGRYSVVGESVTGTSTQSAITLVSGSAPMLAADGMPAVEDVEPVAAGTKQYVASKTGSKYHHISCPGASQIKESNKVYFATAAEAMALGYTPALNCDK